MGNKNQKPHEEWLKQAKELLSEGKVEPKWRSLAQEMGVDVNTLLQSFRREFNIVQPGEILGKQVHDEPPTVNGLFEDKSTNEWVITENGPLVRSLEQLLKACKVDLKIWTVHNHILNQWQVAMKVKKGDEEEVVTVPLYQVKAWLVRKQMESIFPVV